MSTKFKIGDCVVVTHAEPNRGWYWSPGMSRMVGHKYKILGVSEYNNASEILYNLKGWWFPGKCVNDTNNLENKHNLDLDV